MTQKPAVSLAAMPKRRQATLGLARRIEQEGFTGIYCTSVSDGMGMCEALAFVTHAIPFGTSIANISRCTAPPPTCAKASKPGMMLA